MTRDEPSEDLISRADAVKRLLLFKQSRAKIVSRYDMGFVDGLSHAINILDLVPAEPKTKCVARIEVDTEEVDKRIKEEYDITDGWIPVSERLPSERGWYLITVQGMNRFTDMDYYYGNSEWDEVFSKKVIAWMPLPESYREDGKA